MPIVINARTDLYIKNIGNDRKPGSTRRWRAAAPISPPAPIASIRSRCTTPTTIRRLAQALEAPININVRAGLPSVAELEALGVRRVTTATALPLMAMGLVRQGLRELRATGRFDAIAPAIGHPEVQQLFPAGG